MTADRLQWAEAVCGGRVGCCCLVEGEAAVCIDAVSLVGGVLYGEPVVAWYAGWLCGYEWEDGHYV